MHHRAHRHTNGDSPSGFREFVPGGGGIYRNASPVKGGAGFFEPILGGIPPLLAIVLTALMGFVSLGFLQSRGWFAIYTPRSVRGMGVSAALATLFGVWQVCADVFVTRFPKGINAFHFHSRCCSTRPWRTSSTSSFTRSRSRCCWPFWGAPHERRTLPSSSGCASSSCHLDPVLVHLRAGSSVYVGAFVFVFTLAELDVFRRYDFISMYAFRLVFYLWWHIAWGDVRLRWLF